MSSLASKYAPFPPPKALPSPFLIPPILMKPFINYPIDEPLFKDSEKKKVLSRLDTGVSDVHLMWLIGAPSRPYVLKQQLWDLQSNVNKQPTKIPGPGFKL